MTKELIATLLAIHKKVYPGAKHNRPAIAKMAKQALDKHSFDEVLAAFSKYLASRTEYLVSNEHPVRIFLGQASEWVEKVNGGGR